VYITSYNQKGYLVEAIESVLAQTLRPNEVILVDDCSGDGSQSVIAGYESRYPELITAIYHAQNQGVSATRTDALRAVTGDFVTYVDGDDRYLPTKLEKEVPLLEQHPAPKIVFSNYYFMTEDGRRVGTWVTKDRPPEGNVFCETFAKDFPKGSLFRNELVPVEALKQVGFYDAKLRMLEDWDMRIRLTKQYPVAYCDEPLAEYRCHRQGLSSLSAEERLATIDYIWEKNRSLLDDVSSAKRAHVADMVSQRRARFLRRKAKELLGAFPGGEVSKQGALAAYRESMKYHRHVDVDLVLGLLLPTGIYRRLRSAARDLRWARSV
jgi:cellulose synthase/poly-beta-1,6-N-acetylglucosamine synthase-like glycosyltransferase